MVIVLPDPEILTCLLGTWTTPGNEAADRI